VAGPTQIPAESLDIYLRPLMDKLQQLWTGVVAVDGSIGMDQGDRRFKLHAALFCTTHDWPGKDSS
jgi:hypothetical protein